MEKIRSFCKHGTFSKYFPGSKGKQLLQAASGVINMWIRTITVTADIKQIITEVSVIFITKISVPQLHIYFCNISTQSIWSVKISSSCFFSLGSFMCNGTLTFAYWLRQLIIVMPQRDESFSFFLMFLTR